MPARFQIGDHLPQLVEKIIDSYNSDPRTRHINRAYMPSRSEIIEIIHLLLELAFPGFFGRQNLNQHNVNFHVGEMLPKIGEKLYEQIYQELCYQQENGNGRKNQNQQGQSSCEEKARQITLEFLERIPDIRKLLATDVQAAYDGDPAARNTDEVILAYPGVLAVSIYRFAHELHKMNVPLVARIMTEWAHTATGVDIHPGATIGSHFFIDHATGVVVGETTDIGDYVKLYQGVTLGAMSFPKDERGRLIRGYKRHPTVENNVTIYANATVLGGETKLGEGSVVNGSVFLTAGIPANATVSMKAPELKVRKRRTRETNKQTKAENY
ncbi:MAG: serine acetyltransferase [Planctomycetota bacterium]|nr:MAG: serine acetyltransferase [Planctomycetota bacterium]